MEEEIIKTIASTSHPSHDIYLDKKHILCDLTHKHSLKYTKSLVVDDVQSTFSLAQMASFITRRSSKIFSLNVETQTTKRTEEWSGKTIECK